MRESAPGRPRPRTLFFRAVRRRCPACGGGPLFTRWIRMAPACPACGLLTDRGESGYALGGLWLNLLAAEAVNTAIWVTVAVKTWPEVPWGTLQYAGPVTALLMPVLFYPFSRTLFLALDLMFRPQPPREEPGIPPK